MRFLAIADTERDANSGAAGTDVQTIEALRRRGHEVVEVWSDQLGRRIRHGNLHYALEAPRAFLRAVKGHMAGGKFDVIVASQPHGFPAARWVAAHRPRAVFINRSHGWETHVEEALAPHREAFDMPRWKGGRSVVGSLLAHRLDAHCTNMARACHGIIVSTSACQRYIVSTYGLRKDTVANIAQAPPDSYRNLPLVPRASNAPPRILLVSSASFVKGIPVALGALRLLAAAVPEVRITWVTDETSLRGWAAPDDAQLMNRISCLSGLSQEALMRVYDEHDIFLFPSFFEGFGKAFLEAMSRGMAVVASDVGGMHDLITHDGDGLLCRSGDTRGFADALQHLCTDRDRRARLGAHARETALKYSWDRVGLEVEAFCEERLRVRRGEPTSPSA